MSNQNPFERTPEEHVGRDAIRRLAGLGLSDDLLARAALRADADALMCTEFDPPNMEGIVRWGRLVRYLREELVSTGWIPDNSRNFCRLVSPEGTFAIVVSSGDEFTGVPGKTPSTKYAKGVTTVEAVAVNIEWPSLFELLPQDSSQPDIGSSSDEDDDRAGVNSDSTPVWYLLFRTAGDQFFLELSYPDETAQIEDRATETDFGLASPVKRRTWISHWSERIILEPFDRGDHIMDLPQPDDGDDEQGYDFAVTPR